MNKINFKNENILIGYYCIFVFAIVLICMIRPGPAFNWDMLAYVASAKHFEINNPVELHSFVYTKLKDYVSPETYFSLTNAGIQFRVDMLTNPDLFFQELPFFEIRPVYTFSVFLMSKLGVNIFTSTYMVSLISTILGVFILLFAIKDKIYIGFLYILPFFLISFGVLFIARLGTPDAMVFLSLSIFIYLFSKEKITSVLFIIPVFVLIRTDMIIFNFIVLAYIFFFYKTYKVVCFLSFLVTLVFYIFVNYIFHNYGWATVFWLTMYDRVSNPADVIFTVSVIDYLKALARGLWDSLLDSSFLEFISIMLTSFVLIKTFSKKIAGNREIWAYIIIPIAYIFIHFVLFPVSRDRFFVGFYTMYTIAILLLLSILLREYKQSTHGRLNDFSETSD